MHNKVFPNKISQVLSLIILCLFLIAPMVFFEKSYFKDLSRDTVNLFYFVFAFLLLISIVHLINYKNKVRIVYNFKIKNLTLLPLLIIAIFTFQVGLNAPFGRMLNSVFGSNTSLSNPLNSPMLWLGALTLGPLLEEIFFRGILLKGLLETYKPQKAIIISAIIFSILHFNSSQILGALVLGLLFGSLYYKTKSLGLTIVLHFFANLFGLVTALLKYKLGEFNNGSITYIYGSFSIYIIIICLIILAVTIYIIYKKVTRNASLLSPSLR